MSVTDAVGMNRFKSGFIVDNFETHRIGSLRSLDYRVAAIDTQQSVMRPYSPKKILLILLKSTLEMIKGLLMVIRELEIT